MKVTNTRVYGIEESLIASGYPMSTDHEVWGADTPEPSDGDFKRACHLGNAKPGSGHDCYLKGITVQADVLGSHAFWLQWSRYHFQDYISSQSKMHRLMTMDIASQCNEYVDQRAIDLLNEKIQEYKALQEKGAGPRVLRIQFQKVIANCPVGLELTARITTNYLQCKNVYAQRGHHKLSDWWGYCDWLESLPKFTQLAAKGGCN